MHWHVIWLRRSVPQATDLAESVQSRIMLTFMSKMLFDRPMLLITAYLTGVGMFACLMAGFFPVFRWVAIAHVSAGGRLNVVYVIGVFLGGVIIANGVLIPAFWLTPMAYLFWVWPKYSLPLLRRAARECAGIHVCEKCGYDLRGSPKVCPECGTAVAIQLTEDVT